VRKAVGNALENTCKNLLYPSESDEPFAPISWGKAEGELTPEKVRRLAEAPRSVNVQETSLDDFFKVLTSDEVEDAAKFKALRKVIDAQLKGTRVFRLGKVNIDIYVVGMTKGGEWAGLKTKAVES
jgi:hypothetical protein